MTSTANIFDVLRQLPVGLVAAAAFLVLAFFLIMLWLEVAALSRVLGPPGAGRQNGPGATTNLLMRMCEDLDRIEEQLAKLNERLENLSVENRQNEKRNG